MSSYRIILPWKHDEADLADAVARLCGAEREFRILKRSVDARQHRNIRVEYSVATDLEDPVEAMRGKIRLQRERLDMLFGLSTRPRPVVVGTGPGGIFCAYWLRTHGFSPIMLEQGPAMRQRVRDMARFMKRGELQPYSNICFGAGGAGTYSDGKLITRIRSPFIGFVTSVFVEHGARQDIRYVYNPHLGSNHIRQCIAGILESMASDGVDIRYDTRMTDFEAGADGRIAQLRTTAGDIPAPSAVFLATGHSSRETYALLRTRGTPMAVKEFAMGVRVEHPARAINEMQYGSGYHARYPGIETAQYRLARTWKDEQRAVYSFCMCPGGFVLNASTGIDGVVTNGMSNALKAGRFSNAAIVVNVSVADLAALGYSGVDASLQLQRELEERFRASVNRPGSSHVVPGQRLGDFLDGNRSRSLLPSSCLNPVSPAPFHTLFPDFITDGLRRGFGVFDRKLHGFATHSAAQVFGIESRTSSPYRIDRDPSTFASPSHPNLYPVGEGAGFAGGITSAAVDGIRCAQAFIARFIDAEQFDSRAESGRDESEREDE